MEGAARKARRETPLAFMVLSFLGLVAMVGGDLLLGSGAHIGQALIGVVMYFVLFVWTIYRVLTGQSGHRMLGDLFGLIIIYAFYIGFYTPGRFAVWVLSGCLGAMIFVGVVSYYVDWIDNRKTRRAS